MCVVRSDDQRHRRVQSGKPAGSLPVGRVNVVRIRRILAKNSGRREISARSIESPAIPAAHNHSRRTAEAGACNASLSRTRFNRRQTIWQICPKVGQTRFQSFRRVRSKASARSRSSWLFQLVTASCPAALQAMARSPMKKYRPLTLTLVSLCILTIQPLHAVLGQTNVGRISGTVTDTSGAAIVDATIRITNDATGVSRTASTDDKGFYVITNLAPGDYTL